ncbi:DUF262 domain-containing protein [candidate division WOR-3 bacterium]|nr:DUF262 domain-containing protein [candidate division WOR-3 bacterium]
MTDTGSRINFQQLLERHDMIRIPMIQRDYAQGRKEVEEVRADFLDALKSALDKPVEDASLPFNLDFVYGSVEKHRSNEGKEETCFLPLDGQQRLTTLFLLHWYLAWLDCEWDSFVRVLASEHGSRFSYAVRPSSEDFFNRLVDFRPARAPSMVPTISALIEDQPWFFLNWRMDPTIQSALGMLDAIHTRFAATSGLYARLTDLDHPAITFQLLVLTDFGLSEDLYIKMNARGRPLTPFETFKARYERELRNQLPGRLFEAEGVTRTTADYLAWRIDNAWADLFWARRDPASNQYDTAMMNLLSVVAEVTRDFDSAGFLKDLDIFWKKAGKTRVPTYSDYQSQRWLDEEFTLTLIELLDAWSGPDGDICTQLPDGRYFDERDFFGRITRSAASLTYPEVIQFAAFTLFLRHSEGGFTGTEFQEWMRLVRNLAVNTEYGHHEDFQRSLVNIRELVAESRRVLRYFAASDVPTKGFARNQIAEEKLKAELMLADERWIPLLDRAEGHEYFDGQVEFLLDFCGVRDVDTPVKDWDTGLHERLQGQFLAYLEKAEVMFGEKGLAGLGRYRWERALLCLGDYLLSKGINRSFLTGPPSDTASWKRLLRGPSGRDRERPEVLLQARGLLKQLLDRVDASKDMAAQLDALINNAADVEPWREAIIRTPEAIRYCDKRFVRFEGGQVYLLRGVYRGRHAELFTYALYYSLKADWSRFEPLKLGDYVDAGVAADEPHFQICIGRNKGADPLRILRHGDRFRMSYEERSSDDSSTVPAVLRALGFRQDGQTLSFDGGREDVEAMLLGLAARLAGEDRVEKDQV